MLRIGIVAGEVSGDILAAGLINALRDKFPEIEFTGIAGPRMVAAGCRPIFRSERLSVMGLVEVLRHLPELLATRREIYRYFLSKRPDLFIGVDAPDFNLGLERKLHRAGIPTVHYVSPSVWAWRPGRVRKMVHFIDRVLTLFPFEADLYNQHGDFARFVGHPLADTIPGDRDQGEARRELGLARSGRYLAILPGSRAMEVSRLGDTFAETVREVHATDPGIRFVAAMVSGGLATQFRFCLERAGVADIVTLVDGRAREVISAADIVLAASGTASLEAMLLHRPMVVAYRISPLSYYLVKSLKLLKISRFSLPNILAGESIAPEFMQNDATAEKIANAVLNLFNNGELRQRQVSKFREIHAKLKCNASVQAANAVSELLAERDRSG